MIDEIEIVIRQAADRAERIYEPYPLIAHNLATNLTLEAAGFDTSGLNNFEPTPLYMAGEFWRQKR